MKEKHATDGKSAAAANDAALATAHERADNREAYGRGADDGLTPIESLMMRREVRIGVAAIAVLLLIFGYVFVRKINENDVGSTPVADSDSPGESADDASTSNPPPTVVTADGSYPPATGAPATVPGHVGEYATDAPRDDLAPPNKSYLPPRRAIDDTATHMTAAGDGREFDERAAAEDNAEAASKYGKYLQDDVPRADLADRSDGPGAVASADDGSRYADTAAEANSQVVEARPIVEPSPELESAAIVNSPSVATQPVVAQQPPTNEPRNRTYVTTGGETPASIAERLYGDDRYAAALMAYNGVDIASDVAVNAGGEVLVPPLDDLRRSFAQLIPEISPRAVPTEVTATGIATATNVPTLQDAGSGAESHRDDGTARAPDARTRIYEVARGETVYDIARKQLGRVSRWREILQLNQDQLGGDIDAVAPGMRLRLPDEGRSEVARQRGELLWR